MSTGKGQSFTLGQMAIKRWSEHRNPKREPGFLPDSWTGLLLIILLSNLVFILGGGGGGKAP